MLSATAVRTTKLPSGEAVPVLGQGTWHLAEDRHRREEEIHALRIGLDLGMTLIDTAEMYADGGAEELVGGSSRRPARRYFSRQQSFAGACDDPGNDHGMRAQSASAQDKSSRPLSIALAGRNPVGRNDQRVRCTCSGGQDPLLGRQQLRRLRYGGTCRLDRRRERRDRPSALQSDEARCRIRSISLVPPVSYSNHGIFPDRTGTNTQASGVGGSGRPAQRNVRSSGAGLGTPPGGGYRDSKGGDGATRPGKPRRCA